MGELIDTFHIDWKMLIAQMINFAVVFLILYWFALRPLVKTMRGRNEKIQQGIIDAKSHAALLEKTKVESQEIIQQAHASSSDIISDAKHHAQAQREELITQAKDDAKTIVENGKKSLEHEQQKSLSEARDQLANVVSQSTKKILESAVTLDIDVKVIEQALSEFDKKASTVSSS